MAISKEERKIVSYHEVGHALVSALQKNSEPVQKITIVPRTMGALGYVMHVPEDEKYLNTQAELHDMIVGLLGGRAAEEIMFDTVTTGASNDIEKATGIARSMVTRYGMSKKFGLIGLETVEGKYLDGRSALNCAEQTASEIDSEVMQILKDAYEEALQLLRENKEVMEKIAAYLIEKETITGKEFMKIFREAKGLPEPEEEKKDSVVEDNQEDSKQEASLEEAKAEEAGERAAESEKAVEIKMHEEYNSYIPTPEEIRNNPQIQQQTPPQPESYVWSQPNPQMEQTSQDGQNELHTEESEQQENSEISKFGSAWDKNVNGK